MKSKVYKIRDTETGLFSAGGTFPTWSTKGKIWSSLGALKNHLALFKSEGRYENKSIPKTWEIVAFVVSTEPDAIFPAVLLEKR